MYTYIEEFDKKIYLKYFQNSTKEWNQKIIENFNIMYFKHSIQGDFIDNNNIKSKIMYADSIKEYKKIYKHKNIVGTCNLTMQYLYNNPVLYEDNFDFKKIRLGFYDIETSTKIPIKTLMNDIHSIGLYSTRTQQYYILAYHSDISNNLKDLQNTTFIYCKNEKDMLKKFIEIRRDENFDMIGGWNNFFFDSIAISNRIQYHFGKDYDRYLSPFEIKNVIKKRNKYLEVDFPKYIGVDEVDLMELYKKNHDKKFPSYKLDYVLKTRLGKGKIEHQNDFDKFYEEEFEKHCRYLHRDVEGLVELEALDQHVKRMTMNLYSSYAKLDKMNATLIMWENMIWKELYDIILQKKEYIEIEDKIY